MKMTFPLEWYLLFLVSIPQAFLVTLVGLSLFNLKVPETRLVVIAIAGGSLSFLLRFIPMVFGLQIFIGLFIMTCLTVFVGRIKIFPAVCAITAGLVIISVVETSLLPFYLLLSKTSFATLQTNQLITAILFIPEALIMVFIYGIIQKLKFRMWDLNNVG
ncbi:MAG: hypothetical protein ACM3O9_06235 [Methylocystaceae bacterium]